MTIDTRLAEIRARVDAARKHPVAHATVAKVIAPALLAGVEAVRELHQPEPYCNNPRHTNPDVGCPECAEYCTADGELYPCRTVTVLTAPLEVEG